MEFESYAGFREGM